MQRGPTSQRVRYTEDNSTIPVLQAMVYSSLSLSLLLLDKGMNKVRRYTLDRIAPGWR